MYLHYTLQKYVRAYHAVRQHPHRIKVRNAEYSVHTHLRTQLGFAGMCYMYCMYYAATFYRLQVGWLGGWCLYQVKHTYCTVVAVNFSVACIVAGLDSFIAAVTDCSVAECRDILGCAEISLCDNNPHRDSHRLPDIYK